MSQAGDVHPPADASGNAVTPEELAALREKLNLMQQIQMLQLQLNPSADHRRPQPTPNPNPNRPKVKVSVGSYSMSASEFQTYKKDCRDYQTLTGSPDNQVALQLRLHMDPDLKRI